MAALQRSDSQPALTGGTRLATIHADNKVRKRMRQHQRRAPARGNSTQKTAQEAAEQIDEHGADGEDRSCPRTGVAHDNGSPIGSEQTENNRHHHNQRSSRSSSRIGHETGSANDSLVTNSAGSTPRTTESRHFTQVADLTGTIIPGRTQKSCIFQLGMLLAIPGTGGGKSLVFQAVFLAREKHREGGSRACWRGTVESWFLQWQPVAAGCGRQVSRTDLPLSPRPHIGLVLYLPFLNRNRTSRSAPRVQVRILTVATRGRDSLTTQW